MTVSASTPQPHAGVPPAPADPQSSADPQTPADPQAPADILDREALLELAYEAADLGIWQNDLATGEVELDARARAHYGIDAARVPLATVLARVHPDDLARLGAEIGAATGPGGSGRYATEYRVIHPDGATHWLAVKVRVHFAGDGGARRATFGFGVTQDITARVHAEERLRLRTEELERLLDLLPTAVWIADDPHCLEVRGNQYANRLLGVTAATNVSQSDSANSPIRLRHFAGGRELLADELPLQAAARTGAPQLDVDLRIARPDGAELLLAGGAVPLFAGDGRPRGAVAVFHDITARVRAEQELHRTVDELKRSNAELEQFAYVASHDLQEPLRAMSGMVQLLSRRYRGQLDARADEYIDHAVEAASRMQALIAALLAFSRLDRYTGAPALVAMEAVLAAALANLQVACRETGAAVTHDPLPSVSGDAAQLTQVLQNLVGNALKFRGSAPPQVHVSAVELPGAWQFSVADNGIGIDPQYFDRIFLIFQRLHVRRDYPGMGIGLALCKKIVERHGGRIWVVSGPGGGATFYFTLPKPRPPGPDGDHDPWS